MSLLGCEWESIERHEKLRAVVSEWERERRGVRESSPSFCLTAVMTRRRRPPELGITYFGHNLPKTMFKGSYLNFKEDEWLEYGVCF